MADFKFQRISDGPIYRVYAESDIRNSDYVMEETHYHPYCEIFHIENGACRFFIENNMYSLKSGDFLFIPPNAYHYTRYIYGECKKTSIFFRIEDVDKLVVESLPEQENFFTKMHILQTPEIKFELFNSLIMRMCNEEKIADNQSALMLRILMNELFLLCNRECSFLIRIPDNIYTTDTPIVTAAQFISTHFSEQITTADIAAAAGYSPNYLTRKFRETVGIGLHEYLTFVRLQRAALELISTDYSITEIAFRCGFSDSNYFKDAFKMKYKLSPRAFRKQ